MTYDQEQETNVQESFPHSREAEEGVIGSILINQMAYFDIAKFLKADDFYIHRNKWIFSALEAMQKNKTPIDMLTLSNYFEEQGKLKEIGGSAYLTYLVNQTPSSLNAEAYAKIVEGKSIRRKMILAANKIASLAYAEDGTDILTNYSQGKKVYEQVFTQTGDFASIGEMVTRHYDRMERRANGEDEDIIGTGFADLDAVLDGGFRGGDFVIIAARPGMGKTAFLLDIALNAAKKYPQKKVAAFSLEMSKEQYTDRLIVKYGIPISHIRTGKLTQAEWDTYIKAIEELNNLNIWVDDISTITPATLRAKSLALSNLHGLDLLIVDYIGLMDGDKKTQNQNAEVSQLSRSMKVLARELNIPVVCAAQLNRNLEARQNKRPVLSDLRDSGSLEQDTDIVIFPYRDVMYGGEDKNLAEINIAKQRNGESKTIELLFSGELMKFSNARTQTIQLNNYYPND